jgi:predicted outer membrane repeat protein
VAAGEYADRITMQDVAVYGGFAGTETARDQRDPRANVTIVDGSALGSVVTIKPGATALAVLDGFTIRNGKSSTTGGGVAIGAGSLAAIRNNTITGNTSTGDGGGTYFNGGAPVVEYNVITGNKAGDDGGGIYGENGSPLIRNNLIAGNQALSTKRGGGVIVLTASPTIVHNTIVGNTSATGGGILLTGAATLTAVVANNVIAFNTGGGISRATVTLKFSGNAVFGNGANVTGFTPDGTNVFSDPLFVDMAGGNYHLKPGSLAIDYGNDTFVSAGLLDLDGYPRIQGLGTDAGAYEFVVTTAITLTDAVDALRIASGIRTSTPDALTRLDVVVTTESAGKILLDDAVRLARMAAGQN